MTSLVLPAFNPGAQVELTFAAVRDFLRGRPDWEAIFVLDGCTDDTEDRLTNRLVDADDSRMRYVAYAPNRGKGYAVRTGLLAARGAYRIFTDVDLAYRFDDILRVADELHAGAAVAVASREHPDSELQLPAHLLGYAYRRRLQSHVFGRFARAILPLAHRDTQAGLKGMTALVATTIVPELVCDGFGFDCEFLTACRTYAVPVTEVPVRVRYDDAGSSTGGLRTMSRMLRELWRVRRAWHGRTAIPLVAPAVAPPLRKAA